MCRHVAIGIRGVFQGMICLASLRWILSEKTLLVCAMCAFFTVVSSGQVPAFAAPAAGGKPPEKVAPDGPAAKPGGKTKDPKKKRKVQWYVKTHGAYVGETISMRAQQREIAYDHEIPLRTDRQGLGKVYVTPKGGAANNGITANAFRLDRGAAVADTLRLGLAIPTSEAGTLTLEGNVYMSGGVPSIARSFGVQLPYGRYVDSYPRNNDYSLPSFSPQFLKGMYEERRKDYQWRVTGGDFVPTMWSGNVRVNRERNFIDLARVGFRPPVAGLTDVAIGTDFAPDRDIYDYLWPVRGIDGWAKVGPIEVEIVQARSETFPTFPYNGWDYRGYTGGRIEYSRPNDWGVGFQGFHMWGDNLSVASDPLSRKTPAGSEVLYSLDGSMRLFGKVHGYGMFATTDFVMTRDYNSKNKMVIVGAVHRDFLTPKGELRLQWNSVDPNYESLGIRSLTTYPANYNCLVGEWKYPFKGGSAFFSIRDYMQQQPDIFSSVNSNAFAVNDFFFPSNSGNRKAGNVLDWLASVDFDLGRLPLHLYLSAENVHFLRAGTPGLANSSTNRVVEQQVAMLRYNLSKQLSVDVGVTRFASRGNVGAFTTNVLFNEAQTNPRLGINWSPSNDYMVRFLYRDFKFVDGVTSSAGLNNYDCSQFRLEVQARVGDTKGMPAGWP